MRCGFQKIRVHQFCKVLRGTEMFVICRIIVCFEDKVRHVQVIEELYIHGSVHRNSVLIRSNKIQQYAGIYLLQNHSLHVSGVHRTHHQENIKL